MRRIVRGPGSRGPRNQRTPTIPAPRRLSRPRDEGLAQRSPADRVLPSHMPGRLPPIDILFVDAHVVVVNKPSGLLVHRGWDRDDDAAMFRVRDAIGQYVHPLHRLDRGTSGALV